MPIRLSIRIRST